MLSAKRRAQKLRLGRRRATHNVKSAFIVAAEVHAGDLPKREIGGAFVPFRIRPDEQKTHPIRFDRDHLADVAHIWVHLLSVNRYQWKSLSSGQQKLVLALKGQLWFSRLPFVSKLQSSLCKVGVGILLQASHIGNSEALKAVEPQTVTHQTKKKELWTDVHHVSPNGADCEAPTHSHKPLVLHGFQQFALHFYPFTTRCTRPSHKTAISRRPPGTPCACSPRASPGA